MHQLNRLFLLLVVCGLFAFPVVARLADNTSVRKIEIPGPGADVQLSPDGKTLAIYEDQRFTTEPVNPQLVPIHLIDFESGNELQTLSTGLTDYTSWAAFSSDSTLLAASQENGQLDVWDVASGQLLKTSADAVGGHGLAFVPQTHLLLDITPSNSGLMFLWDVDRGVVTHLYQPYYATLADFAALSQKTLYSSAIGFTVTPDGKSFVTATVSAGIMWWDIASGKETDLISPSTDVTDVASRLNPVVTPDGKSLLYGDYKDKQIHILDLATGQETGHIPISFFPSSHFFDVAPDSDTLAYLEAGTDDNSFVHLVSLSKGGDPTDIQLPDKLRGRPQVVFTPDGKALVVSGFWNTDSSDGSGTSAAYIVTLGS